MQFRRGKSVGNDWECGAPAHWDWSKNNRDEFDSRDFFSVHWEVNYPKAAPSTSINFIRLHVSSPPYTNDASLNEIKRDMIEALTIPSILNAFQQRGYACQLGSRISTALVQKNRSTEPFRIVLHSSQLKATHKENLKAVHAAVGDIVDEVIERFAPELNRRLDRHSE